MHDHEMFTTDKSVAFLFPAKYNLFCFYFLSSILCRYNMHLMWFSP